MRTVGRHEWSRISSTSVPDPGALVTRARPPCRSIRPTIDSRTPRRSGGTAAGIEARPAVAHEHLRAPPVALRVDVHGRARAELGRVGHGLTRRGHDRLVRLVELSSPTTTTSDRYAVLLLHLGGGRLERAHKPAALPGRGPPGEPRPQLALLPPSQRRHLRRILGAPLHHRERLEHGVVQVRRHLGALLGADALRTLLGERPHEPHDPRRKDHAEHHDHGDDAEQDVARRPERTGGLKEDQPGRDHERDAHARARDRGRRAAALLAPALLARDLLGRALRPRRGRRCRLLHRLSPDQRSAGRDQDQRPYRGVREPQAQLAERQEDRHQEQAYAERHLDGGTTGADTPARRSRVAGGDQEPAERVRGDADTARRGGHHEGQPDE